MGPNIIPWIDYGLGINQPHIMQFMCVQKSFVLGLSKQLNTLTKLCTAQLSKWKSLILDIFV